ncbi:MAG TPA: hypothetical protein VHU84_15840 [Lacipirellulaceae bacterium]|jgi:hypothetical protein|nr:hypothetical protein [Lacipirellulaceae bacterium]
MRKNFKLVPLMALCIGIGFCLSALIANDAAPASWQTLEKNYAQANLELAQARLAQAKSENQTVNDSVSRAMLAELESGVQVSQEQLKQLESGRPMNSYAPRIQAAENAITALENDHAESVKANKLQAGAVGEPELRRELAEIAVAKARLAAIKAISQQPPEVRIQWEIGELQDQIRALWARPLIEN